MTTVVVNESSITVSVAEQNSTAVDVSANQQSIVVEAKEVGPQGPAGVGYVHQQATVSTVWTINHNLGYRPSVEIFDTGNQEIDAEVSHPTINQAVVTLNPATAGSARLN